MTKVITYGTYDLLHYGHIRLLERAKALGDYLIVGVTADDFDKVRGKINVQQPLMERVEAVRATGIADEIIIEEYEGQKIDDIRKYDIDIFTVGSDWIGKFDYLNEYCKVVYLERTEGVSSSEIREKKRSLRLGIVGDGSFVEKMIREAEYVNGLKVTAVCTKNKKVANYCYANSVNVINDYEDMLNNVDGVYIRSMPEEHYTHIQQALIVGKHVLCESPVTLNKNQLDELIQVAQDRGLVFTEAIKTAYATAYSRLLLLIKGGKIGQVKSVDATCTSLRNYKDSQSTEWNGFYEWGPTAMLPIFQILGTNYRNCRIVSSFENDEYKKDIFTKIDFLYENSVASIKVADGIKSEGELIVSGTEGYLYVPAPWWKTDYFEIRFENQADNKRYFYQLDGEGIRYELVAFARAVERGESLKNIDINTTRKITEIMEDFVTRNNMFIIE